MAGGVGSDGERPWIVVGDRLKGPRDGGDSGLLLWWGAWAGRHGRGARSCVEELPGLEASDGA